MLLRTFLFFICILFVNCSLVDYISDADLNRYAPSLVKTLVDHKQGDFISHYYALKVFDIFNYELPLKLYWESCVEVEENFNLELSAEEIYKAISIWAISSCEDRIKVLKNSNNKDAPRIRDLHGKLPIDDILKKIKSVLEDEKTTVAEIRYALESLDLLKQSIPNGSKIGQKLQSLLKNDDSFQSYGHVFHAAALLKNDGIFASQFMEDVIVQADEVDGKMLQWEGGLMTTSSLITGLLRFSNSKSFTQSQADKFATYLMSRKFIQNPKGILALVEAAKALAVSNVSPMCVTYVNSNQITVDGTDYLKIRISDLFGKPLRPPITSVVAQSATRVNDDVVVLSKQPFTSTSDPTVFSLSLKLEPGTYRMGLTAGSQTATLTIHVLGPVSVEWLEVGVSDSDGTLAQRLTKLEYPNKLSLTLQSDASQRLVVRFALTKLVHQAFLRLFSNNQEIMFIAEHDSNKIYKVDVHLASELSLSSLYSMELIIGDFSMSNKIRWVFGNTEVKLASSKLVKTDVRGRKSEIEHVFRPAEKRPPTSVSMLFTGFIIAPLVILFIMWYSIGINFKNFSFTSIPFHISFVSILGLFTLFWVKLNMFQTSALLIPLGALTFLTGHRVLKGLATQKNI